eukprot:ANDGO_00410.mRNA.1 Pre-mRNA-splicing factor CEF1
MRIYVKGGHWKNSEDEVLKAGVQKYGLHNWDRVASLIPRKSARQCKMRWDEWLDPSIQKGDWTPSQEEKLAQLASIFPNQWKTISEALGGGRTATMCLEHYQVLLDRALDPALKALSSHPAAAAATTAGSRSGRQQHHHHHSQHHPGGSNQVNATQLGKIMQQTLGSATGHSSVLQEMKNPETMPAKPDAVDMDEAEKEMLAEAQARLANTMGKKARRKAREQILEEAKRTAQLQKERELRAAGIPVFENRKKRAKMSARAEMEEENRLRLALLNQNAAGNLGPYDVEGENQELEEKMTDRRTYVRSVLDRNRESLRVSQGTKRPKSRTGQDNEELNDEDRGNQRDRGIEQSKGADVLNKFGVEVPSRPILVLPAPQLGEQEWSHLNKIGFASSQNASSAKDDITMTAAIRSLTEPVSATQTQRARLLEKVRDTHFTQHMPAPFAHVDAASEELLKQASSGSMASKLRGSSDRNVPHALEPTVQLTPVVRQALSKQHDSSSFSAMEAQFRLQKSLSSLPPPKNRKSVVTGPQKRASPEDDSLVDSNSVDSEVFAHASDVGERDRLAKKHRQGARDALPQWRRDLPVIRSVPQAYVESCKNSHVSYLVALEMQAMAAESETPPVVEPSSVVQDLIREELRSGLLKELQTLVSADSALSSASSSTENASDDADLSCYRSLLEHANDGGAVVDVESRELSEQLLLHRKRLADLYSLLDDTVRQKSCYRMLLDVENAAAASRFPKFASSSSSSSS